MNHSPEQLVGRVVGGRYRLERAIGAGGMGAVFHATQLDLGRAVAVKVLLDADVQSSARLRQEAMTAGNLSCPYVVSIFDFQAPPGEPPFVVMELLTGESLAARLTRERALPVAEACRIAVEALIGLDFAHRAGVLHRDIKPSNLWLSSGRGMEGHVKVLDFGIAKSVNDTGVKTTTGSLLGTPAYLSPEQLRGQEAGARTDQHALGVVLFEMLTGVRPWRSQGVALYAEVLERVPPWVNELAPHVPPALAAIVARALAKDPAARFASADELRLHLAPFASAGTPSMIPSLPYGTPMHANPPTSQRAAPAMTAHSATPSPSGHGPGWIVALVASLVVVPLAGIVIYLLATRQTSPLVAEPATGTDAGVAVASALASTTPAAAPAVASSVRASKVAAGGGLAGSSTPATGTPNAQPASAAGGSTAVSSRTSPRCLCLDARDTTLCVRALTPKCTCEEGAFRVCPVATDARGTCPTSNILTGATLKTGGTCKGFRAVGTTSVPATGKLACATCYGRPTEAAVPGSPCQGMRVETDVPDFTRQGHWVCDQ